MQGCRPGQQVLLLPGAQGAAAAPDALLALAPAVAGMTAGAAAARPGERGSARATARAIRSHTGSLGRFLRRRGKRAGTCRTAKRGTRRVGIKRNSAVLQSDPLQQPGGLGIPGIAGDRIEPCLARDRSQSVPEGPSGSGGPLPALGIGRFETQLNAAFDGLQEVNQGLMRWSGDEGTEEDFAGSETNSKKQGEARSCPERRIERNR